MPDGTSEPDQFLRCASTFRTLRSRWWVRLADTHDPRLYGSKL